MKKRQCSHLSICFIWTVMASVISLKADCSLFVSTLDYLAVSCFFFMLTFQLCSFSSVCKLPFLFLWSSKMLPCQMISYKSARQQEVVNLSPQCTLLGKSFRVWLLQQTLSLWSVSVTILWRYCVWLVHHTHSFSVYFITAMSSVFIGPKTHGPGHRSALVSCVI